MIVDNLFAQNIAVDHINIDCYEIENYCYEMKNKNFGRKISNVNGWQSDNLLKNECEKKLFIDEIENAVNLFFKKININLIGYVTNLWININHNGAYNLSHTHSGSFFSGTIYIKTPKNSGNLCLVNPIQHLYQSYTSYWHLDVEKDLPLNKEFSSIWSIIPNEKTIIIFPSWIEHYVSQNESSEDRISISFNTGVKK